MCSGHLDEERGSASERIDQDEEGGEEQRRGQDHLVHVRVRARVRVRVRRAAASTGPPGAR